MPDLLRPYHLVLAAGLLTAFLSLFCKAETIDVHIHDTYYILGSNHILLVSSVSLLLMWLLYAGVSRILFSNKLVWLHVVITIVTIAFIIAILLWIGFYDKLYIVDFSAFGDVPIQYTVLAISFLLLIAGQLLFVVNLVGGIISRQRGKSNFNRASQ